MSEAEPSESLGTCCLCECTEGVRNILNVSKKSPTPGRGWGCMICDLPCDGAIAVLCDFCFEKVRSGEAIKFACKGFPALDGRVPFSDLAGVHRHDKLKHAAFERQADVLMPEADLYALQRLRVPVEIGGLECLAILAAIQLASRHPNFQATAGFTFEACVEFGRFLQEQISITPNLAAVTEAGWHSEHDVKIEKPRIITPG